MAALALAAIGLAVSAAQAEKARQQASKSAKEQKERLAKLDAEQKALGPPAKQDVTSAKKFARKTGRAGTIVTGDLTPVTQGKTLLG